MKHLTRPESSSFASAIRLNRMLAVMDDSARNHIFEHMRDLEAEVRIQNAIDKQLEAELQFEIYRDHKDGTKDSLLYERLPLELRQQVFSHVVAAEQSIHVFPPKGNESHGFRLSLCDESNYDFDLGSCRCEDSRQGRNATSDFCNNALFLVSQRVRREALDAFFMTNKFTFTCLYELVRFSTMFTRSSSRIQRLRLFERVDDYPASDFRLESVQNARARLRGLKHLELYVFLASWSNYEELYEDGLIDQLLHFALGPPPAKMLKKRKRSDQSDTSGEDTPASKTNRLCETRIAKLGVENARSSSSSGSESTVSNSTASTQPQEANHTPPTFLSPEEETVPNPLSYGCLSTQAHQIRQQLERAYGERPSVAASAFPIPPLKSFTPHIKLRTPYLFARSTATSDPKQAYYDGLYKRLGDHLTDVYMDAGRRYRVVENVPKLGPKPKVKIRDDEKPLKGAEKRGILFLRD